MVYKKSNIKKKSTKKSTKKKINKQESNIKKSNIKKKSNINNNKKYVAINISSYLYVIFNNKEEAQEYVIERNQYFSGRWILLNERDGDNLIEQIYPIDQKILKIKKFMNMIEKKKNIFEKEREKIFDSFK